MKPPSRALRARSGLVAGNEGAAGRDGGCVDSDDQHSEGTLGGLVSQGNRHTLGALVERALEAAQLCGSDPLCAEHDPREHGRLYGAARHACLFASETSCERGNQYLDRALLVDTLATSGCGFFT